MSKRRILEISWWGFAALLLWGCATVPPASSPSSGEVAGEISVSESCRFSDVPVPETLQLDSRNSYVFENEYTRIGVLRYETRSSAEEIVVFFKREMPNAGWSLINLLEYGTKSLSYQKHSESCNITIYPGRVSVVAISITPRYGTGAGSMRKMEKGEEE